ncbi:related to peroxisomal membrane protein 4 [Ramularia collo-cygni]|uniref:Related to peroxisomal membrane protein 4 n=1 Tax=Ramularia collo-cygni TaxID=112498 RepID=A0A2D3US88_9PEZI|nr:related to peroxisomal membrane protein 4 [Ramularia collo-cygni]CZT17608.1 related to peroxisomal membrane protein 4 [Ramularia collo-cygni]
MATTKSFQDSVNKIILDPKYHEPLTLVKAIRNGVVYGIRIRFPHALVLVFLFGSGTMSEKIRKIARLTRQHAQCLANFAFIYKLLCMLLKRINRGKQEPRHSFIAGLLSGYWVFGRDKVASSSVVQQMVMYAMGRVIMGLARYTVQMPEEKTTTRTGGYGNKDWRRHLRRAGWPVTASFCWATIMWLFTWHPQLLQPTMRSSLTYIYDNAEKWDSFETLLLRNQ